MLQGERLQKLLRQLHFRRWEAQVRGELANLLRVSPEAIQFVDWDYHDTMINQLNIYRMDAEVGSHPTIEIEWNTSEKNVAQETIDLFAEKIDDKPAYLYIQQYIASFALYKGWEIREIPMIQVNSSKNILHRAIDLLDYFEFFSLVINERDFIEFGKTKYAHFENNNIQEIREVYLIKGFGLLVVNTISFYLNNQK